MTPKEIKELRIVNRRDDLAKKIIKESEDPNPNADCTDIYNLCVLNKMIDNKKIGEIIR